MDSFLEEPTTKQPFELYEGPPEFLPLGSPIFIFQKGEDGYLRAIARFIGYYHINGWKSPKDAVNELFKIFESENVKSHDSKEEMLEFCSQQHGIRGMFIFNPIIEIKYGNEINIIKRGDVVMLFKGKLPYSQGFPYRYLSKEMVEKLLKLLSERAENKDEIKQFL